MDKERSEVSLKIRKKLELQLIVCVPDEKTSVSGSEMWTAYTASAGLEIRLR